MCFNRWDKLKFKVDFSFLSLIQIISHGWLLVLVSLEVCQGLGSLCIEAMLVLWRLISP